MGWLKWLRRELQAAAESSETVKLSRARLAAELESHADEIERINREMSPESGLWFSIVGSKIHAECLTCGATWPVPAYGGTAICPNGCNARSDA